MLREALESVRVKCAAHLPALPSDASRQTLKSRLHALLLRPLATAAVAAAAPAGRAAVNVVLS